MHFSGKLQYKERRLNIAMEKIVKPIVWPPSLLAMIFCRKSGNVYAGALLIAILDCWIVTGASAML